MTTELSDLLSTERGAVELATEDGHRPPIAQGEGLGDGLLLDADSEYEPVLTVVLPTLNEEAGVAICIEKIKAAVAELAVPTEIIVSDSSTDRTPDIAREKGAIVVEPDKPGYGYAYRYAFRQARGDVVVMGDADTTYDFESIPRLLEPIIEGNADIVMGSRLQGEIEPGAMPPLHRYVGNPLLTRFLNLFYNAGVSDAHSGFRVFTRDALETLDLESDGMEFASEMVMDAAARNLVIEEGPITYHDRVGEETLDSVRDGWRHIRFMLVNAPGYLFSVPGVLLSVVGVLVMSFVLLDVAIGSIGFGPHSMVVGSLLTIAGYQVASLGVFANVAGDPIRTPSDPITEWLVESATLEKGATVGVMLFGLGGMYATFMLVRWIESGFTDLPFLMGDIAAMTVIVLGVQTVFGSFFLSTIGERS